MTASRDRTSPSPTRKYKDGAEAKRIEEANLLKKHWRRWGPYLSERNWATVREDYSADGDAWRYFPFEHSHLRAYRWGEDGIAGISDNHQRLCLSLALWNEKDHILKERLFGLTGHQGNHGEDVKEQYFYLDNTPTHSYQKYLYKYPQNEFPYEQLVKENANRSRNEGEFELMDTGVFDEDCYFDVIVEYAKHATNVDDTHIVITVHNRGPESAPIHILPHLWFRNDWSWHCVDFDEKEDDDPVSSAAKQTSNNVKPDIHIYGKSGSSCVLEAKSDRMNMYLHCDTTDGVEGPIPLFTDNETNLQKLYGAPNRTKFVKDGINERVVLNNESAVNTHGTKSAVWYKATVPSKSSIKLRLRFSASHEIETAPTFFGTAFDAAVDARKAEADQFYGSILSPGISPDMQNIQRQSYAGMLWSKQFYHFVVKDWLDGDKGQPTPPKERKGFGRNRDWRHLHVDDILSMPDKWEYPFFAAWDTAFHTAVLAQRLKLLAPVDPWFAKKQLLLLTREWYMHPTGQIPAYEWNFSDVNPPVHAWAAFQVYKTEKTVFGNEDKLFLERVFQKLLLNFTWWVNKKDADGLNVFEGGFLGLDNIAVFNRSEGLPTGGHLRQADGTSWMAMFCLNMLEIALELAPSNRSYEDIASKFLEHFLYISDALSWSSEDGVDSSLWHEEDGFYYDNIVFGDSRVVPLKVRSLVGLIPLFPVLVLEPAVINSCPDFKRRMNWFFENFDFTKRNVVKINGTSFVWVQHHERALNHFVIHTDPTKGTRILLALVPQERLVRILGHMLDENEFLSPYGIRSLSKFHLANPYSYWVGSTEHRVDFLPAESNSGLFGGNSNWRGPIWLATTFLLIQSLQRFHRYYGDSLKVECPSNHPSAELMTLDRVADEIMHRIIRIFLRARDGNRPVNGGNKKFNQDEHFRDLVLFYEYFDAETAKGLGASHQTGWTGLVGTCIQKAGKDCEEYGVCFRI
ncbi:Six-hairpin glycosidase-like protein [Chytriomyces sp. MP71]|nr:Six-hairpin glycosidase-like protein [Chytriomyces sp. MP71]